MPATEWPLIEGRAEEQARTHRGRHQNHELASYRRTKAVELRLAGRTFTEIAREVGYTNKGTAYNVVNAALKAKEGPTKRARLQEQMLRFHELLDGLAPAVARGDVPAVLASLKILDARARLLDLFPPQKGDPRKGWDNCAGPPTVVIGRDDCRWEGCLRHGRFPEPALMSAAARNS